MVSLSRRLIYRHECRITYPYAGAQMVKVLVGMSEDVGDESMMSHLVRGWSNAIDWLEFRNLIYIHLIDLPSSVCDSVS